MQGSASFDIAWCDMTAHVLECQELLCCTSSCMRCQVLVMKADSIDKLERKAPVFVLHLEGRRLCFAPAMRVL